MDEHLEQGDQAVTTQLVNVTLPASDSTHHSSSVLTYILVPLGSVIFIIIVIVMIVFILKRSRLEQLRHHLMPLYNFDTVDSGGDWETDLLEEERRQQQVRLRDSSPPDSPLLKSSGYHSTF
ncbi:small integral membrane protein 29-like isoform X2 [Pomacea canaliculata]|uniref:small integral membrane protein 29-like isoform X2 n=1 Tax=Pomacea canaliculata TaxID=400727 RepID=UPI000D728543|nr:small integral membrane protein 29-like isoform X2 [Pomacea canaliculata]